MTTAKAEIKEQIQGAAALIVGGATLSANGITFGWALMGAGIAIWVVD